MNALLCSVTLRWNVAESTVPKICSYCVNFIAEMWPCRLFSRLCNVWSLSGMSRYDNDPYLRCDTCIWGLNRIRKSFRCYQDPLVVICSGWGCCLVMMGNSLQFFWKNLHNSDTHLQLVCLKTFILIDQTDFSRVTANAFASKSIATKSMSKRSCNRFVSVDTGLHMTSHCTRH